MTDTPITNLRMQEIGSIIASYSDPVIGDRANNHAVFLALKDTYFEIVRRIVGEAGDD